MIRAFCVALALNGLAGATLAQDSSRFPPSYEAAREMSKEELATVIFGAAPYAVLAADPQYSYLSGDLLLGVSFLLRGQPAVDGHMIQFKGICSFRRVHVTLGDAGGRRTVADIDTDLTYAVVGPASILSIEEAMSQSALADPLQETRDVCAAFDSTDTTIESESASLVMRAANVLATLSDASAAAPIRLVCNFGEEACPADILDRVAAARLRRVTACEEHLEDPDFGRHYGIESDAHCVDAELLIAGGQSIESVFHVMAFGPYPGLDTPFAPSVVLISEGEVIID